MPIRCAVVGLNRGARFVELLRANPHCEVVAVCDERPDALARFSGIEGYRDYREMLDRARPEVVAIVTPGPLHAEQSIAALEAGVHVLVETPNVYSVEDAARIVDLSRRAGLKYMLAEDYVFMGWCRRVAELIDGGELGDILGAMGEYTHDCRGAMLADEDGRAVPLSRAGEPGVTPRWRLAGLPPLAYCSHTLGPILSLLGDRCIAVCGTCGGMGALAGTPVYPLESAVFTTAKGAVLTVTNGFMLGHPLSFFYAIYGTTGAVRIINTGTPRGLLASDRSGGGWRDWPIPWAERDDGRPHLQVMVDAYIDSGRNDTVPPFDEARSMDFCLPGVLAHESARRGGERMAIPLF